MGISWAPPRSSDAMYTAGDSIIEESLCHTLRIANDILRSLRYEILASVCPVDGRFHRWGKQEDEVGSTGISDKGESSAVGTQEGKEQVYAVQVRSSKK